MSDGYVVFSSHSEGCSVTTGMTFWDADLGRPVGARSHSYTLKGQIPGLYIREFTNGWAVYNHSGAEHRSLCYRRRCTTAVASGLVNTAVTHVAES